MAFYGKISEKDISASIAKLKNTDAYQTPIIPKDKTEHFILKSVYLKGNMITPAIHKKSQDIYII